MDVTLQLPAVTLKDVPGRIEADGGRLVHRGPPKERVAAPTPAQSDAAGRAIQTINGRQIAPLQIMSNRICLEDAVFRFRGGSASWIRDRRLQSGEAIVQRQRRVPLQKLRLRPVSLGKNGRTRRLRTCLKIPDRRPLPPLRNRLGVDGQFAVQLRDRSRPVTETCVGQARHSMGRCVAAPVPCVPFHGLLCKPLPVAICRAPVTNVSHSASFHSEEQITQSNQRIKHLGHHIATTSGHGFLSLPDRYRGVAAFRSGRRSGAGIRRHFDARIPDRPGHVAVLTTLDILFGRRTKRRQDRTRDRSDEGPVFPPAIPLIAGPGAITTMISLTDQTGGDVAASAAILGAMVVFGGLALALFLSACLSKRILGDIGSTS